MVDFASSQIQAKEVTLPTSHEKGKTEAAVAKL
jgi:hypothetical protein